MPSFSRISRRPVPIRPLALACALLSCLALDACKTTDLHPASDGGPPNRWIGSLDPLHRNVDILFLIDDSSSMRLSRAGKS